LLSALAALIIAMIVVILVVRKKRKKKAKKISNHSHEQKLSEGYPMTEQKKGTVVLEKAAFTVSSTATRTKAISTYQPRTETLKLLTPGQLPLNELEIGKEIGEGTYGRVCVGKWKKYRVALKFCQNRGMMDEFMREANLMSSLPPHPNVVRMYGVSIDGTQPIIVMEYCGGGSLDRILFNRNEYISLEQMMHWIRGIATGMRHLHHHNIIHRDLAARNILLSESERGGVPKISDFGMSRVLLQDNIGKTKSGSGPVCWMAPESISQKIYSKKSDVWMFGMVVYEIVARQEPHADKHPLNVSVEIRERHLVPEIPRNCPPQLRTIMLMCWNRDPVQRPVSSPIRI
jgi:serine/threonine protein kinase